MRYLSRVARSTSPGQRFQAPPSAQTRSRAIFTNRSEFAASPSSRPRDGDSVPRMRPTSRVSWAGLGTLLCCLMITASIGAQPQGAETSASAVSPAPPPSANSPFEIPFERYSLDNGLTVILHRDTSGPTVAVNLWYRAGPVNEPEGRSGFAHLFEHLMFEGSKHAGRQFDYLLESIGGTNMNATTSWDRTNYFETVPAQHLELALWLEADRMGFMIDALTQERLDVQRDVVKNERRESYENRPYGPSALALYNALYPPGHPHHGAVIGSMEDLSRASLDDAAAFFSQYYSPGNATLVLAGHFDEATARRLIDKHFATLPARPVATSTNPADSLPQPTLPSRIVVAEQVSLPRVRLAWPSPPAFSEHEPALEIASRVLAQGKTSRLYRALVATSIANDTSAGLDTSQLGSTFLVDALAAEGHTTSELEAVIAAELASLAATGPSSEELARAKNAFKLEIASELQYLNASGGDGGRAGWLQRLNHYLDDPGALPKWIAAHDAVTADGVRAAVATFLTPNQQLSVVTELGTTAGATP